eukprot:TRINITY_DN111372_c0_g1_i1.p1 TRINITY_DN111372_c0_g1~~TRINITY_DN111372_c0_g1_i1.p1  ORF type:complete len:363 (-),score=89.25 TRINITY_DN111372_c0_g1_i1:30-1088(-)
MLSVKRRVGPGHKPLERSLVSLDTSVESTTGGSASFLTFEESSCSVAATPVLDVFETLIFLDWDDTLFPSTDIFDNWGQPAKPSEHVPELDTEKLEMLQAWQEAFHRLLTAVSELSGHCAIVTNARRGWVEECMERFAPDLCQLLSQPGGPQVVYAQDVLQKRRSKKKVRDFKESLYPVKHSDVYKDVLDCQRENYMELVAAKYEAMKREFEAFFGSRAGCRKRTIISLGDMEYEHDAVQELGMHSLLGDEELRIKSLLLPEAPQVSELTLRLDLLRLLLPALIRMDQDLSADLKELRLEKRPFEKLAETLHLPALRDIDFPAHAWGVGPRPSRAEVADGLVELAVSLQSSR